MRLSRARASETGHAVASATTAGMVLPTFFVTARRMLVSILAVTMVFAMIGIVFAKPGTASADTPLATDDVFASVGNSTVNVYDPTSGALLDTLVDDTGEQYTTGSAFDSSGDFYVSDLINGDISEFAPDGTPMGQFATGLNSPESLVFDSSGNLYVGNQLTPYIDEFAPDGTQVATIGPLATELYGDDWIDLAADQCTFYYTSEGTDIMRYNKCTNTQESNFNQVPMTAGQRAFEVRILADGDVLVADSTNDYLMDPNGNVIHTYSCILGATAPSNPPANTSYITSCQGQLFSVAVDPDGTDFWTGDSYSGNIWEVNIATGAIDQQIDTGSGLLYGLSVKGELRVAQATSSTTTQPTPTTLTVASPTTPIEVGQPTQVSAVLTNSTTNAPIAGEPVTLTLNGTETCTATTDSTGTATCSITPGEPSGTYTLTASFAGDSTSSGSSSTTQSPPNGSSSGSGSLTIAPDTTSVTYTGPTGTASAPIVNGQPITLTATLTTDTPTSGTPLPTKPVTFTIGSGSTAQSCTTGVTDANGDVSCTIPSVNQPTSNVTITTSFAGDSYDTPVTATTAATVTEPTILTVNTGTSAYSNQTNVSATLTDAITNQPISGESVTLTLNGTETCTATTNSSGVVTCPITPGEAAGTYTLTGSFGGDTTLPLQLASATGNNQFVVTLDQTELTYTGNTTTQNGQSYTLSGVLTSNGGATPVVGQTVTFTLGSGSSAQTCTGVTNSTGLASCTVTVTGQPQGPIPVTDSYTSNGYYQSASASATVNLPEGTSLTVSPGTGTYNGTTTLTGTLMNTTTNEPVPNQQVTLTVNGTQSCTATTNASGVASCSVTTTEAPGTYSLTGTFGGNTTTTPVLLSTSGSSTFTEKQAPTTVTYTGSTTTTAGQAPSLSATLTTASGTPLSGQTVTFTVGTGSTAQKCSAVTNSAGKASCSICMYNQSASPLPVTVTFGGNTDYAGSSTSESVAVTTPTTLKVSAGTGTYGQSTTLTGTLTNSVTGAPVGGQTITLSEGTQSCTATTNSSGKASCSIMVNQPAGSYPTSGSFAGNTSSTPPLLASSGSSTLVVSAAPTSVTYTGSTSGTEGQSITLSGTLTSNGTALSGQTVTLTLGSGNSSQSCTAVTNSSGAASCSLPGIDQVQGNVTVTVTYAGNSYYASSSTSSTVKVSGGSSGGGSGGGEGQSGPGGQGQGGGSTGSEGSGGMSGGCQDMGGRTPNDA
jgi:hypothetical protein